MLFILGIQDSDNFEMSKNLKIIAKKEILNDKNTDNINEKIDYDELCNKAGSNLKNPSPPSSPSTKSHPENAVSPDIMGSSFANNKETSSDLATGKKFIRRKPNAEEHAFFICNMFFIFFLPYVCRIKPVSDEDIPEPDSRDSSELAYNKTKDGWAKRYLKYSNELEKYEAEKSKDPKFIFFLFFNIFFSVA
jgi:hypothetical protein